MKNIYLYIAVLLSPVFANSQISYSFTAVSGTYSSIAGTTIHAATVDDVTTSGIPIGFTFNYGCLPYNTISVSSNGWVSFNTTTTSSASNSLSTNTIGNIAAPLWDDLQVYTGGTVSYLTSGTAPNRVLTVQWSTMEWYYGASGDVISFQLKLYETSNRIEFIYSQGATAVSTGSASIGLSGATGDFYSLNGTGTAPTASKVAETATLSTKPATGQIYRWDPTNCSGVATAGTATVSPSAVSSCSTAITLSSTGYSTGCGMSYQWQWSPDNSTWTDITGATTVPYVTTATQTTNFYRLKATCTNSASTAYSGSVSVTGSWSAPGYSFTATTGTYASIAGTTIHAASVDDAISAAIPIGFTFTYGCQSYTQVVVSSNGWLSFNALTGSTASNALASTTGNILAPLWDDLATSSTGLVRYTTSGTSPNRIFTVEWYGMEWTYSATSACVSFEVILTETSNRIDFVYKQEAGTLVSSSASIGLNGGTAGMFYSLDGTGSAPNVSTTTETTTLAAKPATNQIYRWTPTSCSGTPVGGTASATPSTGVCASTAVALSASGYSTGCGLTYQWQYSPDNSSWSNLTSCGFAIPTTAYPTTSPTYYRLQVTCTSSGLSAYSSVVTVNIQSAPTNDEPCNATVLSVGTSCSFSTSSNSCATASEILQPTLTAPGCGTYSGGDVWFTVTVPASGRLIVDLDECGGPTDMDMAWYTGATCSNLTTLIECDAYDSQNGSMPMICRTGTICTVPGDCAQNAILTPGTTVWIRVWENGNDVSGNFDICAYDPGAASAASTCASATVISGLPYSANGFSTCCGVDDYDATVGCASTYQNGEDFLFAFTPTANVSVDITLSGTSSYTGVFVTNACPSTTGVTCVGSNTNSGGNPSLCGLNLTGGVTYYIMIDTYPSPNCTDFSMSIRESSNVTCGLNYTASTMTFAPDTYAGTAITLPIDDRFSTTYIPIGFPFCYDGIQYTQLLASSNSYVIFDPIGCATNLPTTNAAVSTWSDWAIASAVPNTDDAPRNAIMFPWHDTYPSSGGTLTYQVLGTSPNRRFVLSFDDVPMFSSSCTAYMFTGQLKLFETTNNIEMHLERKDMCSAWNSGQAILGLHNYNGTIAVVPSGYNSPTQWTAYNQAWRFTCNCAACLALPVEYLGFNGKQMSIGVNRLFWATATEINNDYFNVQRMNEYHEFVTIAQVDGSGNSNSKVDYEYVDNTAPQGVAYYRLEQVDFNGQKKLSSTIAVGSLPEVVSFTSVSPNPASSQIEIKGVSDGTPIRIVLVSSLGQEIILEDKLSITGNFNLIYNVSGIASGAYLLKAENEKNEIYFTDKIIIQNN